MTKPMHDVPQRPDLSASSPPTQVVYVESPSESMAIASTTPPRPDREAPYGAEAGRPRRPRRLLWWVVGSVVAIIFAPLILFSAVNGLGSLFTGCSDAERAALTEFPHYGGIVAEPDAGSEGGCFVDLPVGDPPDAVIAYYGEQLTEHGWTLEDSEQQEGETSEGAFEVGRITAHRDGSSYAVDYEAMEGRTITLVVHVSEV
jgi:hypothetical protein